MRISQNWWEWLCGLLFLLDCCVRCVHTESFIGCNHDFSLCSQEEMCIQDGLFGRCQVEPYDLHQYEPGLEVGQRFVADLEGLVGDGARWKQPETQCTLLYYYLCTRLHWEYDPGFCHVSKPDQILLILQLVESELFFDTKAEQMDGDRLRGIVASLISERSASQSFIPSVDLINQADSALSSVLKTPADANDTFSKRKQIENGYEDELKSNSATKDNFVLLVRQGDELEKAPNAGHIPENRINVGYQPFQAVGSDLNYEIGDDYFRSDSSINHNRAFGVEDGELYDASKLIGPSVLADGSYSEELPRYFPGNSVAEDDKLLNKKDDEELGILNQGTGNNPHRYATRKPVHPLTANPAKQLETSDHNAGDKPNPVFVLKKKLKAAPDSVTEFTQLDNSPVFQRKLRNDENAVKVSYAQKAETSNDDEFVVPTLVVCGVVGATLILLLGLYVVRARSKTRLELNKLAADVETRPGKDYEDLCRQHMISGMPQTDPLPGLATALSHRLGSQSAEPSPKSKSSSTSSWCEEPVLTNLDISAGHMILSYLEEHLSNQDKLNREWNGLRSYQPAVSTASQALLPPNIAKNRYPSIIPYDHTRVLISSNSNQTGSDYINASNIIESDPKHPSYIVCQSPTDCSGADMWQMVWEKGSVVVVNLAMLMEERDGKCSRYWPSKSSQVYHGFEVHLVSEHIWCEDYVVRSFYLKNLSTNETRTVTQFHFVTWEDHGVPGSSKALLEFRRKVNKSYRGRSCPIIIHCSDGSGRSGTYCLLDIVLNRINKGVKEIDIAATLEHLRDQRMDMVESLEQFEFVLNCVAEEIQAILSSLPRENNK